MINTTVVRASTPHLLRRGRSADGREALRSYLTALGPGLITGASDDDPSGIATYSQAGASSASACCGPRS